MGVFLESEWDSEMRWDVIEGVSERQTDRDERLSRRVVKKEYKLQPLSLSIRSVSISLSIYKTEQCLSNLLEMCNLPPTVYFSVKP